MLKILLIGDLHLRAKKLKDVAGAWSSAIQWAHKNSIDLIIQAGDVFDHANVYGREYSTGTIYGSFLSPFIEQEKPLPLFVIPGNHDIGAPKDKDAISPLDGYPWMHVVRKPSVVKINDHFSICAVPWINRIHILANLISKGIPIAEATQRCNTAIAQLMTKLGQETRIHREEGRFVLFVGHLEITGAKREGDIQQGGSFEFSADNLASVGANAYALAHIHVRQNISGLPNQNDGYLGSLCQGKFGEEGNQVGCRLLEIDKQNIIIDRWLDNKSSPRYFTVESLDGLNYRPSIDYVKLRGRQRPSKLPEGVIFERLPEELKARLRTEEKLDCDLSLRTLLKAWKDVTNCEGDLDLLVSEAEKLQSLHQVQGEAIGSLDRIKRIRIKNLTCHGNSDINMDVSGLCGIAGPNGTGKTTALETLMLALYGRSPSRPKISSMLPKGESVEAAVQIDIVSNNKNYAIRREFSKIQKQKNIGHKAYVFDTDIKSESLASGADGVTTFSTINVGDPDLVLAGVFSSQGDAGNLVNQLPAQRKDLFAKLLGTEKFFILSEAAKKLASSDLATIQAEKTRLETVRLELANERSDVAQHVDLGISVTNKQKEIDKIQSELDVVNKLDVENKRKEIQRLSATLIDLERKKQKIISDGKSLKQKRQDLDLIQKITFEEELVSAKAAKKQVDAISSKIAERSQKALQFERDMNEVRKKRQTELKVLSDKLAALKTKFETVNLSLGQAKKRAGLLTGFPDLDVCKACPLAKDSIESRSSIPELEIELEGLSQKIPKGESVLKKHQEDTESQIVEAKGIFENENNISDIISERNELLKKTNQIEDLEEKQAKVNSAKAEIKSINLLLDAAVANFKEIDEEIKTFKEQEDKLKSEFDEAAYKSMIESNAALTTKLKALNTEMSSINVEIGRYKAKIEQHAERKKEAKSLISDIDQKQGKISVFETLGKAFGRDGIPQLIVDSAIPHLQEIMFDMMSEIDGKWTIRISTQKETNKGTVQERIEILVDDGEDERDISTYSGGEMNLLATIIRVAFSILQAERTGKGLKVLVLDEAMYFADNDHAEAFMRMLHKLPKYFNQIFVISHSEFVLSSIQNKIFFARGKDGKTIVQTDFSV
jgi:DNA repair exonuclease SbcCD ATPase subunit